MKRTLSFVLALIMVLSFSIGSTFAYEHYDYDGLVNEYYAEIEALKAEKQQLITDYKIVHIDGKVIQEGMLFIVRPTSDINQLSAVGARTDIDCYIETSRGGYGDIFGFYDGYHCYLGEKIVVERLSNMPITVNHMGPLPSRYYEIEKEIENDYRLIEDYKKMAELQEMEEKNAQQGIDTIFYDDNSYYVGETGEVYSEDWGEMVKYPHGEGAIYNSDGVIQFKGHFVDGVKNGLGTDYSNGIWNHYGNYVDGYKQGYFIYHTPLENDIEISPFYYIDDKIASYDTNSHQWVDAEGSFAWTKYLGPQSNLTKSEREKDGIYMNLGNPLFFAYGEWKWHEKDNFYATPVATPEGRTLIPIRSFIEAVGGTVEWDGTTNQVIVTLNPDNQVIFTVGSNIAIVNGISQTMDVKAQVINGKTMIPLRFACESVGITDITYDAATQSIIIQYPQADAWNNGLLNNPDAAG